MTQNPNFPSMAQLLRRPVVEQMTGLSRTHIYRMMAAGEFPQSVSIGARAVAWRSDEVSAWIESRTRKAA
ncbi:AlpA family transcriptional regulator [Chitinibacter sp. FCG-7]|uniref:AlpA family transcriptional regulator n=1 Tax=Chitinibacter mangrovi TaxID=3153927 RepID=A0AAU7F682_9NEIS